MNENNKLNIEKIAKKHIELSAKFEYKKDLASFKEYCKNEKRILDSLEEFRKNDEIDNIVFYNPEEILNYGIKDELKEYDDFLGEYICEKRNNKKHIDNILFARFLDIHQTILKNNL